MLSDNQRRWKERFDQARDEALERDRQREADRLASKANPPKPDRSGCLVPVISEELHHAFDYRCPLGTMGCTLKHDGTDPPKPSYAEQLKAWNEKVNAGQPKSHWTGD